MRAGAGPGSEVVFDRVLLVRDDARVTLGTPLVKGAAVKATLVRAVLHLDPLRVVSLTSRILAIAVLIGGLWRLLGRQRPSGALVSVLGFGLVVLVFGFVVAGAKGKAEKSFLTTSFSTRRMTCGCPPFGHSRRAATLLR